MTTRIGIHIYHIQMLPRRTWPRICMAMGMTRSICARSSRIARLGVLLIAGLAGVGCVADRGPFQHLLAAPSTAMQSHRDLIQQYAGLYDDTGARRRIESVGRRVLASSHGATVHCQFELLCSINVNALSTLQPTPTIYITHGLYERLTDDDLFAAAIAHELAHIEARHGACPCPTDECQLRREIQADRRATEILEAAGFDRGAMSRLLRLIRPYYNDLCCQERLARLAARP